MSNMNESVEQALNKRPLKEKEDQPTTVVGRTAKIPKSAAGGNSNRRSKKPRRAMPEMKDFLPDDEQDPSLADVVGGRGGRSNHHPGNRPYWVKILAARDLYRSCASDHAKTQIASRIKDHVQQTLGGRFLNLDEATKKWFLLPDSVILDKIKQALRDRYVPFWAKNMTIEPVRDFSELSDASFSTAAMVPTVANTMRAKAAAVTAQLNPITGPSKATTTKNKTPIQATNLDFLLAAANGPSGGSGSANPASTMAQANSRHIPVPTVDDALKRKIDMLPTFDNAKGFPGVLQNVAMGSMGMGSGGGGGGGNGLGGPSMTMPLGAPLGGGAMSMGFGMVRPSQGPPSLGMLGFHSVSGLESLGGVLRRGSSMAIAGASSSDSPNATITDDDMKDFLESINATTNIAEAAAVAAMMGGGNGGDDKGKGAAGAGTSSAAAGDSANNKAMDVQPSVDMHSLDLERFLRSTNQFTSFAGSSVAGGGVNSGGNFTAGFGNSNVSLDYMRSILGNSLAGESMGPSAAEAPGMGSQTSEGAGGSANGGGIDWGAMYKSTLTKSANSKG